MTFFLLICLFSIDEPEQTGLDLEKVNIIGTFFGGGGDMIMMLGAAELLAVICKLEKQT